MTKAPKTHSKKGEAISPQGRTAAARKRLRRFIAAANQHGDLDAWRRGRGVLGYIQGRRVVELAQELGVTRGAVNRWLRWYEADGVSALVTGTAPGATPKLSEAQRQQLGELIDAGPQAAGERPRLLYQFTPVFYAKTFHHFLKHVIRCNPHRKVFLVLDNGACHNLDAEGKAWLAARQHRIELFRLPPYSPELNPIEGGWKTTKKRTTHNRFFHTTHERDAALVATFEEFRRQPPLIAGHVERFL